MISADNQIPCVKSAGIVGIKYNFLPRPDTNSQVVVAMQVQFNNTDLTAGTALSTALQAAFISGAWTDLSGVYSSLPVTAASLAYIFIGPSDNG